MKKIDLKYLKTISDLANYDCTLHCEKCYFCIHHKIGKKEYTRCLIADIDNVRNDILTDCFESIDVEQKEGTENDKINNKSS